jgi:hypothetical protein
MSIFNFFTNKNKDHIKKAPIIITPKKIIMMNLPIHVTPIFFVNNKKNYETNKKGLEFTKITQV